VTPLAAIAVGVLAAMAGSELALRGTKLQTALSRVVVVWTFAYLVVGIWLCLAYTGAIVALTIFWGGSFLIWFGVRSHVESSILLRMLVLLRDQPVPEAMLVERYVAMFGEAQRVEELRRSGLVRRDPGGLVVTIKGAAVLRAVAALR
jgi:hypothetical protein